jgi:hypothetical protein
MVHASPGPRIADFATGRGKEEELIARLRARPPYDDDTARKIRRIYTSNNTAFETWKGRQRKDNLRAYEAVRMAQGPIQATELLQDNIGAIIELVHALPSPEVHVATLGDTVLTRIGQAAICEGLAQRLHRVQDSLSHSSQTFCQTWQAALTAAGALPDTRWGLAKATDHWYRLEKAAAKK